MGREQVGKTFMNKELFGSLFDVRASFWGPVLVLVFVLVLALVLVLVLVLVLELVPVLGPHPRPGLLAPDPALAS